MYTLILWNAKITTDCFDILVLILFNQLPSYYRLFPVQQLLISSTNAYDNSI